MHMADALLSPAMGGTMWAATAGTIAYCSRRVSLEENDRKVPLMGVLGAFIFAVQMINFTIPGTGSSGHLGGGMILAILLGPHAAFLVMASVLTVQALFFADGGLLALGCNIFNLAFFPCFIAYPFIYRKIAGSAPSDKRILTASLIAAVIGLQLGSLAVVLETVFSGISDLPFTTFLFLMQPIHLAIGLVEGFVTAAVVLFVLKARPEILRLTLRNQPIGTLNIKVVLAVLLATAVLSGGLLSWFASSRPDGLEWSISKTTGRDELKPSKEGMYNWLTSFQEMIAFLPDYGFRDDSAAGPEDEAPEKSGRPLTPSSALKTGTSLPGLIGGAITFLCAGLIGLLLRRRVSAS